MVLIVLHAAANAVTANMMLLLVLLLPTRYGAVAQPASNHLAASQLATVQQPATHLQFFVPHFSEKPIECAVRELPMLGSVPELRKPRPLTTTPYCCANNSLVCFCMRPLSFEGWSLAKKPGS